MPSPFPIPHSQFPIHNSQFTIHNSPFTIHHSQFPTPILRLRAAAPPSAQDALPIPTPYPYLHPPSFDYERLRRPPLRMQLPNYPITQHSIMPPPPDTLNQIGVLKRREIEARILAPFVEALSREFDRQRVIEILRDTIIRVAREQGAALARQMGDDGLHSFAKKLALWSKDDALQIEMLEQTDERLAFNVTRCRYAEMYRALGIPELGAVLSCNRDFSLIEGFNPRVKLTRTQTIMEGAACCDFRYELSENRRT